ncbi:MAG: AAA family ATPase [Rhodothermales bacterium]
MEHAFFLFVGLLLGFLIWFIGRRRADGASNKPAAVGDALQRNLYSVAEELEPFLHRSAHPRDLLTHARFQETLAQLVEADFPVEVLLAYAAGENLVISCLALEALAQKPEDPSIAIRILERIQRIYLWPFFFATRAMQRHGGRQLAGRLLLAGQTWWKDNPILLEFLRGFVGERIDEGERITFEGLLDELETEQADVVEGLLAALHLDALQPLAAELHAWRSALIDRKALGRIGTVWAQPPVHDIVPHAVLDHHADQVLEALRQDRSRSALVVGDAGVGKTTLIHAVAGRLQAEGWIVFEAGAMDVVAGQMFVGQLEERVQELMRNLAGHRKVLWVIADFHDLIFAGWHRDNPRSVLDMIAPFIENGSLTVLGETEPAAYERIVQVKPLLRSSLKAITVEPLDDTRTLDLARAWSERRATADGFPPIREEILREALQLARQYLDKSATPGNLLDLLRLAQGTRSEAGDPEPLRSERLIATLTELTGLPASLLSERERLDLDALRALFQQRVLGQPEAVDCLVERVAMIKAGLCDPSRPSGVFLFVGPTGTGKTEIAKTLAQFLFGNPDRMIRLDMSEFMTEDALRRLLGDAERGAESVALVNQIRKQPFSVVLLDEFEKAHPGIWDLFLQVFDDGRLTDRRGNTADFRHAIIILTSNLGAAVPAGNSVGFGGEQRTFSSDSVERAARQTFRPEFLNRIDRVVVFRPLSRTIARDILLKELRDVLTRRGLRNRDWAVEWEDSALDFLLEKGFSNELGARPLKRAIERYLLSPLAMTIVNHQFPEGDQFLFVRSAGDGLDVEFIDPDQADTEDAPAAEARPPEAPFQLQPLVLEPLGTRAEVDGLVDRFEALLDAIESDAWEQRKAAALERTAEASFWEWDGRYDVLSQVEFMDRIERAADTAESLLTRLQGEGRQERSAYSPVLIQRLAQRLYVLERAIEQEASSAPRDAFLLIDTGRDGAPAGADAREFAEAIGGMYVGWAQKRQMRHTVLQRFGEGGSEPGRMILAVTGFGSYGILAGEDGWHVWEAPGEGKSFQRLRVRVRVAPQPVRPADTAAALRQQAEATLAGLPANAVIVRRYRKEPSPLVRDSRGAWRTGRLDRVLAGDFDVMGGG